MTEKITKEKMQEMGFPRCKDVIRLMSETLSVKQNRIDYMMKERIKTKKELFLYEEMLEIKNLVGDNDFSNLVDEHFGRPSMSLTDYCIGVLRNRLDGMEKDIEQLQKEHDEIHKKYVAFYRIYLEYVFQLDKTGK